MTTIFNEIEYKDKIQTKDLTSLKIEGFAKGIFYPKSENELVEIYKFLTENNLKFIVLGNGTNSLFSNKISDFYIISTKKLQKYIKKRKNNYIFSSSCNLSNIFEYCLKNDLKGFEKLATIPGLLGGAVKMNASCFGDCISDNLVSVKVLKDGKIKTFKKKQIKFEYRKTNLDDCIILSATFCLNKKNKHELLKDFSFVNTLRKEKQPKGFSLGSTFKNPAFLSAGYLIEQCGLKGINKNDAIISEKHANFIINKNNACFDDVFCLIELIKEKVKNKYDIDLELEIDVLPKETERDSSLRSV